MNTKMKQIALPLVVVIAVLLAFSSPAAAEGIGGYAGNHPLTIYDHDTINGGLVFETVTDGSAYTPLHAMPPRGRPLPSLTQEITISIPEGATVKMARLYNYYCWSTSDWDDPSEFGLPAEADMWFDGHKVSCNNPLNESCPEWCAEWYSATAGCDGWRERMKMSGYARNPPIECRDNLPNPINYGNGVIHYWDTKGQNYPSKIWDFPSGVFAWDVTDMVKPILDSSGSGTYTAKIQNRDLTPSPGMPGKPYAQWERIVPFGFGLLVVYEHPDSPEIEYGIAEGCDYLMSRFGETPENATTSATFGGVSGAADVALTTVWTHTESGIELDWDASRNMMYFNGERIGPSTAVSDQAIGLNYPYVNPALISSDENVLEFQDRNDDSCVHNAFLVVEVEQTIPANVTIKPETLNLNSKGKFTAFITLPEGYDVADIDTGTVECEGAPAIEGNVIPGKDMLEVKFNVQDLVGVPTGDEVEMTVAGKLTSGEIFVGSDTIRVIEKGKKK